MKPSKPLMTEEEWRERMLALMEMIATGIKEGKKLHLKDLDLIDTDGVCRLLDVTARTVANYRNSGELRFTKRGNRYYYRISDVKEMLMKDFARV